MKKGALIFNLVLSAAVVVLFILHFSGKGSKGTARPKGDEDPANTGGMKTMYVNTDSISANYQLMRDMETKFQEDNMVRQQKLESKQATLQHMIKEYQNKVMTMTTREQQKEEEKIQAYQQQLQSEAQELSQMAGMQQEQMMIQAYDSLYAFFNDYAKAKGVDMILAFQKGGGIYYINPKYDVTSDAVQQMNQRYLKSKPKEETTSSGEEEKKEK